MQQFSDIELRALQVCLASSRFESVEHLRSDLVDNPHLASAHQRVLDEIVRRSKLPGSDFHNERAGWANFAADPLHRSTLESMVERLRQHPDWTTVSTKERVERLRCVARPLVVSDKLATELLHS